MIKRYRVLAIAAAVLVPLGLTGCGVKNRVSGRVTFEGRPAQWGYVQFTPNLDKENDGPTVTLKLDEEGQFSSAREKQSLVPGHHKVVVSVTTAAGPSPPTVERRFEVDIPQGGTDDLHFDLKKKQQDPEEGEAGKPQDAEKDE